jgi:hypothetical protein
MHIKINSEDMTERDHLGYPGVSRRTILKYVKEIWSGKGDKIHLAQGWVQRLTLLNIVTISVFRETRRTGSLAIGLATNALLY